MRVLPSLTVRSIIVRSRLSKTTVGAKTWRKSVSDEVPSRAGERRHTPWSKADAYTVAVFCGSSSTSSTPNDGLALPFQTSVNVAPPSCDSYRPGALAFGSRRTWPPAPITCERPRTAIAEPTNRWLASDGSTTIREMPRPRKEATPGATHVYVAFDTHESASFVQWLPPSVVL